MAVLLRPARLQGRQGGKPHKTTVARSVKAGPEGIYLLEGEGVEVDLISLALRALVSDHEGDGVCLPVRVALASERWAIIDTLHLEAHPAKHRRKQVSDAKWHRAPLIHMMVEKQAC